MFSLPPRRPACSEINDKDMKSEKDYYAVLGVAPSATPAEIKEAFKKLALQYHPDRNKSADANERMSELLKAYQALNNPEERKNYDAQRKRGTAPQPSQDRPEVHTRLGGQPVAISTRSLRVPGEIASVTMPSPPTGLVSQWWSIWGK